jgi:imidazolonepropionase-like amidohydrolase
VDDRNGTVEKFRPDLYQAVIREAHLHRTRVVAHVYTLADAHALVEAGVDGFAHLPRDLEVDDELVTAMRDGGMFAIPNLSVNENGTHTEPPEWIDDPLFIDLVPAETRDRIRASYGRRTPEGVARARETYGVMQRSLAKLNAGGVYIGFGTDAGAVPDQVHAFTDHRELELMVQAGMTPMEAIQAATRISAAIVNERTLGLLAPEMSADFVVLDGNPLDDIRATRRIARVFQRGVETNRAALLKGEGR